MLHFILYKHLSEPTSSRVRYTREQMEEFASSFYDVSLAPGLKLKEVWALTDKESARLVNQEEGYAELWHSGGRVVLLGDSAVKMTSMSGLGVNVGMHSAALLASELQRLVANGQQRPPSSDVFPDTASLEQAFTRYQQFRQKEAKRIYNFGYAVVRQVTWNSWLDWFIDRILLPWYNKDHMMRSMMYPMVSNGQVLSYVPFNGKEGLVPWRRVPEAKI
ncbi:hypothetical protein DL766_002687 [Monosporascus sp. MC13-8B]|uniref:FAD-binding domain-containing protein n=1 Tax=Monosporascus cannonballus TaxID=155416 RepID=A0ABY0H638_9PEZI|nr:hypothetical protein DL762_006183 [Monosporascus cannonballus]RYO87806.1 hypothetical protein DL763_006224 [Monosporascus cannonballus]RYP35123.1 hypothetical protein DL766_002687 [Monosporascus sp. MC13-8B]